MTVTSLAPVRPPVLSTRVYLVAWTGGDVDPSFQSFTDAAEADQTFEAWVAAAHDRTDRISMVEQVLTADGIVVNAKVREHCPAWQENPDEDV